MDFSAFSAIFSMVEEIDELWDQIVLAKPHHHVVWHKLCAQVWFNTPVSSWPQRGPSIPQLLWNLHKPRHAKIRNLSSGADKQDFLSIKYIWSSCLLKHPVPRMMPQKSKGSCIPLDMFRILTTVLMEAFTGCQCLERHKSFWPSSQTESTALLGRFWALSTQS